MSWRDTTHRSSLKHLTTTVINLIWDLQGSDTKSARRSKFSYLEILAIYHIYEDLHRIKSCSLVIHFPVQKKTPKKRCDVKTEKSFWIIWLFYLLE